MWWEQKLVLRLFLRLIKKYQSRGTLPDVVAAISEGLMRVMERPPEDGPLTFWKFRRKWDEAVRNALQGLQRKQASLFNRGSRPLVDAKTGRIKRDENNNPIYPRRPGRAPIDEAVRDGQPGPTAQLERDEYLERLILFSNFILMSLPLREQSVMLMLMSRCTRKQIGAALGISRSSVHRLITNAQCIVMKSMATRGLSRDAVEDWLDSAG
jgi:hypothetical protein